MSKNGSVKLFWVESFTHHPKFYLLFLLIEFFHFHTIMQVISRIPIFWAFSPFSFQSCISCPHKNNCFKFLFRWIILKQFESFFRKKKFNFCQNPPKITFWTPKLQTLIKTVGNIFDRRYPEKPPLNWSFSTKWYPCLHTSLFFYSCTVHNNPA